MNHFYDVPANERRAICEILGTDPFTAAEQAQAAARRERDRRDAERIARRRRESAPFVLHVPKRRRSRRAA